MTTFSVELQVMSSDLEKAQEIISSLNDTCKN